VRVASVNTEYMTVGSVSKEWDEEKKRKEKKRNVAVNMIEALRD